MRVLIGPQGQVGRGNQVGPQGLEVGVHLAFVCDLADVLTYCSTMVTIELVVQQQWRRWVKMQRSTETWQLKQVTWEDSSWWWQLCSSSKPPFASLVFPLTGVAVQLASPWSVAGAHSYFHLMHSFWPSVVS